jgi:hypothetical protein
MRFRGPLSAIPVAVILAACGDDVRSPIPTQPDAVRPSVTTTAVTCDPAVVRSLITQLYPPNSSGNTREGLLNKFDQGLEFMPEKQTQAWSKFTDIMRKVDDDFDSGRLPVLISPTTSEVRAELFARLIVCAGYPAPEVPTGGDIIVGVIDNINEARTFISTGGDYAVQIPRGMFSQPVVILGSKQSDGFIVQNLYEEFPIKTEITVNPPGKEVPGKRAIVKVCQYEEEFDHEPDRSFMRIVQRHDIPGSEGPTQVVEVLQFTTDGPFLICPEAPPVSFISDAGFLSRSLASAARALRGAKGFVVATFGPQPLYAASAMVDGGAGGFVDNFFSFYAGAEIPDLRIQSIETFPEYPSSFYPPSFEVVVENIGFGASPPSTLRYTIVNNSAPNTIVAEGTVYVGTVAGAGDDEEYYTEDNGDHDHPGETEVSIYLESSLPEGNYTITVTADHLNDVAELNETATIPFLNNTSTGTFTVTDGYGSERVRRAVPLKVTP